MSEPTQTLPQRHSAERRARLLNARTMADFDACERDFGMERADVVRLHYELLREEYGFAFR